MIVYNVTIKVNAIIAADWRLWMKKEHIPALIKTGCFEKAKMFRLLEQDDTEGPTFCLQYFAKSMEMYQQYIDNNAAQMREETLKKWGDKYIAFRSLMQEDI